MEKNATAKIHQLQGVVMDLFYFNLNSDSLIELNKLSVGYLRYSNGFL